MDISAKILREVEFRDRLRGYDTDEVDDFLERVAVGFDELSAELAAAVAKAERAEHQAAAVPTTDDDSIKRTLVLAARTADLAVKEAQEEAAQIVEDARAKAALAMAEARESADQTKTRAESDLQLLVDRLSAERSRLEHDVASLVGLVSAEQTRIVNTLRALLGQVEELNLSPDVRNIGALGDSVEGDGPDEAPSVTSSTFAPSTQLDGLLSEEDDELEDEVDEELDLHFAIPDPPRPVPDDSSRPGDPATFREQLVDPLDPDEELWDRWAKTGEGESADDDPTGSGSGGERTT
jgi:cell division initiation protein